MLNEFLKITLINMRVNPVKILWRACEIILSLALLTILLPFFAIAVLIVQLDSPGPVIFKQKRVGRNGNSFTLYKLRSMKKGANGHFPSHTQINDPRFSRISHLVRATCVDEVPQLWNIIKGDMSLIGPRPELPKIVQTYNLEQLRILRFKPGLFGISQLAFREGIDYNKKIDLENRYYHKRTFFQDSLVFLFTPLVLVEHSVSKFIPFIPKKAEFTNTFWLIAIMEKNGNGNYESTIKQSDRAEYKEKSSTKVKV